MLRILRSLAGVLILACAAIAQSTNATQLSADGMVFVTFDFPGAFATRGYAVNNKAEIVGSYDDDQFNTTGFLMSAQGRFRLVDPLHTGFSEAYGINDARVIVGTFQVDPQLGFAFAKGRYHAIANGADINLAVGVNRFRDIVGGYADVCCDLHGFLFRKGQFTTIDYPGASSTIADAINDAGVIVGVWRANGIRHGFKLESEAFTAIDVPDAAQTISLGINSAGTIVGLYLDSSGVSHGFLLRDGAFQTIDVPGASSTALSGINDFGIIVGDYIDANGVQHGFFGHR